MSSQRLDYLAANLTVWACALGQLIDERTQIIGRGGTRVE